MKPKIGLVLSGGGARGFAHAGVIKVLEKHDIEISAVAGSSMGSIIGAFFAAGISAQEIEKNILNFKVRDFFKVLDISFSRTGLIKGEKAIDHILSLLPVKTFEELKIPLVVNAVDIINEKEVAFSSGDLYKAISAATCFPGFIEPKKVNKTLMMDGGLKNPLALGLLDDYDLDFCILVNVSTGFGKKINKKNPNIIDIFKLSVSLMQDEMIDLKLKTIKNDYILIQPDVEKMELWEINKSDKLIEEGENSANKKIDMILNKIKTVK
ncbi:hypothetical protein GF327_03075 [Candidatus Woesearchaeota archaeon]|nr:hypothetical protein [Candidatus Woesearchaeota archaeon]